MELLADRDPEEARKLLDPVLALMMEAVHRFERTVNQVMGDGIMALFAPLAHEDHAVRACYAALRMQQSVKALPAVPPGLAHYVVAAELGSKPTPRRLILDEGPIDRSDIHDHACPSMIGATSMVCIDPD